MGSRDRRAAYGYRRLHRTSLQVDRGADALLAYTKPTFEQGLRAEGTEQRDVHRSGHDPPHTSAADEGRLAEHFAKVSLLT